MDLREMVDENLVGYVLTMEHEIDWAEVVCRRTSSAWYRLAVVAYLLLLTQVPTSYEHKPELFVGLS